MSRSRKSDDKAPSDAHAEKDYRNDLIGEGDIDLTRLSTQGDAVEPGSPQLLAPDLKELPDLPPKEPDSSQGSVDAKQLRELRAAADLLASKRVPVVDRPELAHIVPSAPATPKSRMSRDGAAQGNDAVSEEELDQTGRNREPSISGRYDPNDPDWKPIQSKAMSDFRLPPAAASSAFSNPLSASIMTPNPAGFSIEAGGSLLGALRGRSLPNLNARSLKPSALQVETSKVTSFPRGVVGQSATEASSTVVASASSQALGTQSSTKQSTVTSLGHAAVASGPNRKAIGAVSQNDSKELFKRQGDTTRQILADLKGQPQQVDILVVPSAKRAVEAVVPWYKRWFASCFSSASLSNDTKSSDKSNANAVKPFKK